MNVIRRYSGRVCRPVSPFEMVIVDKENKSSKIVSSYPVREDGSVIELDVDQFSGQSFLVNPNGFITNDIMIFEESQSDSVARAVLERLKVLHPESVDQNLSIDGMMGMIIPSNYGSPAEFVSGHKMVAQKIYKLYQNEVRVRQEVLAKQASERVSEDVSDLSQSVPNPE